MLDEDLPDAWIRNEARILSAKYRFSGIEYEDVLQMCMLAYIVAQRKYISGGNCSFRTYLGMECKWRMLDEVEKVMRRIKHKDEINMWELAAAGISRWDDELGDRMDLSKAMGVLDNREREVIEGVLLGTSEKELGASLGCSESRISQLKGSAIKKLRSELKYKFLKS